MHEKHSSGRAANWRRFIERRFRFYELPYGEGVVVICGLIAIAIYLSALQIEMQWPEYERVSGIKIGWLGPRLQEGCAPRTWWPLWRVEPKEKI